MTAGGVSFSGKVALESVGLTGGLPRPPLQPLNDGDAEAVRRMLREADHDSFC